MLSDKRRQVGQSIWRYSVRERLEGHSPLKTDEHVAARTEVGRVARP